MRISISEDSLDSAADNAQKPPESGAVLPHASAYGQNPSIQPMDDVSSSHTGE
ncbi:MAG: hypothetical protein LBU32_11975 [Clostridiales bacterium]|nr:hypothetical protein [Clostridiales bacterium]